MTFVLLGIMAIVVIRIDMGTADGKFIIRNRYAVYRSKYFSHVFISVFISFEI